MRTLLLVYVVSSLCTLLIAQSQEDTKALARQVVRIALAERLAPEPVIRSVTQKHLSRLGDSASVALLQIIDVHDLTSSRTIQALLPIIEVAFSEPRRISLTVDRKPNATLRLLDQLRQDVSDESTRQTIKQTISYVKKRTQG
jgi:hypothetical protein